MKLVIAHVEVNSFQMQVVERRKKSTGAAVKAVCCNAGCRGISEK